MPTRSYTRTWHFDATRAYRKGWGGGGSDFDATQRVSSVKVDSRVTSANLPNWKALIARGLNASTSLYGTRHERSYPHDGSWRGYVASSGQTWFTSGEISLHHVNVAVGTVSATVVDKATTQAATAFTKNYRNRTRQIMSGAFMGELMETVRMLASPGKSMRRELDKLLSNARGWQHQAQRIKETYGRPWERMADVTRRNAHARKAVRNLTDAARKGILEWNFGVNPLVQDLDDAARAFRAMDSGRTFDIVRIRGDGEASSSTVTSEMFNPGPGMVLSNDCRIERVVLDECQVTFRGAWRNQNPSGQMPLPMVWGTTMSDFAPTIWELLPYSWLADYFGNIQDVLDTWSMRFITFAWLNRTTRSRRVDRLSDVMTKAYSTPYQFSASGGSCYTARRVVERVPATVGDLQASFYFRVPGLGSARKWVNLAAISPRGGPRIF